MHPNSLPAEVLVISLAVLLAVTIAAASSTRPVLERRRPELERAAGEPVVLVYGATGTLARQLENGAPYDVFLAADEATPARLAAAGLLDPASVRVYAVGTLVLVAPKDSALALPVRLDAASAKALLAQPFERLAIASPKTAPYGRAALQVLERVHAAPALRARVVEGENVEQALTYVASGNAELGLVAASVALGAPVRSVPVDSLLYDPVRQAGGIAAAARAKPAAARALEAAVGKAARAVWESFGYRIEESRVTPSAPPPRGP